jgi:hypothetical protein
MAKTTASVIPINARDELVDAKEMGARMGFTGAYISRMAQLGRIPWVGLRNGARVYRRFNPATVRAALAHETAEPEAPKPVGGTGAGQGISRVG